MNWYSLLAALFIALVLTGCAQATTGQAQAPYAPYSPENTGTCTTAAVVAVAACSRRQRAPILLALVDANSLGFG